MEPNKNSRSGKKSRLQHMASASSSASATASPAAKVFSLKQKVEESPRAPQLIGRIVEKGFSSSDSSSSSVSLPQPTILPFPVARHRSHGPHWSPANVEQKSNEEDMNLDKDETNYDPLSSFANPIEKKDKKDLNFSMWRELISNDNNSTNPQIKKKVLKSAPKTSKRELKLNEINAPLKEDIIMHDINKKEDNIIEESSLSLEEEIEAENLAFLNNKSNEEIIEAQSEVMQKLNPEIIQMLKKRGKNKLEKKSSSDFKREKDKEIIKGMGLNVTAGEWLETSGKNNFDWKNWSERVEKVRVYRFSLDGDFLGFVSLEKKQDAQYNPDSVSERDFIRTEGDPSANGYTIKEAVSLTRSVIPGQRALALNMLSSILNRALCNLEKDRGVFEKSADWQAIWAFAVGPEPQLALSLRMAMDDNHDSVVISGARTILSILSYDFNETYVNASQKLPTHDKDICMAPVFRSRPNLDQGFIKGGFWKYNTKPSNLLPDFREYENEEGEDEKSTVKDDLYVAQQDVAAGFIRMSLLPRICYLLEMDPNQNLEETLVSILIALARHSPQSSDAILKCPRLIENVAKILNNKRTAEIHSAKIKALILFKVLSKYNKQNCLEFIKNGIFQLATWTWYKDDFSLDKCLISWNLIVEQLRFWRVYINHGLCISNFTDFFSQLSLFLSPPIFEKLNAENTLEGFTSVTREAYLVLNALAQKLPVNLERENNLDRETWSWSHARPMVDLALKWLESKNIPVLPLVDQEVDESTLSSFLGVFSSILHMLNSILEKITNMHKTVTNKSLPWVTDFVSKLGLALINNGYEYLFTRFTNIRKSSKNYDLLLACTSCIQGLVRVSFSIDKLVHGAKSSCTNKGFRSVTGGEILEAGIINQYLNNNLSEVFSILTLAVSKNSRHIQSIEIFNRGGPAPGLGFGWGAPGGGFWFVGSVLTRLDSGLILDLIEIFTILPLWVDRAINFNFTPDEGVLKRINTVLEVCLTVGPGDRNILERGINIFFDNSVLRQFVFYINYFIRQNNNNMGLKLKQGELIFSDEEILLFTDVLTSHLKTRWLGIKKKIKNKEEKTPDKMETIHEEIELNDDNFDPFSDSFIIEWAHQRLPVPVHWILSPILCTSEAQNSGLFILLGFEAISSIYTSIYSPISEISLIWKIHSLSFCLYTNNDVLTEEKSRVIFEILQGMYSQEIQKMQNLDFPGVISENYSTFLENLIEQFSAVSYGDALFGRQVAVYLHKKVDVKLRVIAWNLLYSNSVLELLPNLDNCLGGPHGYLGPIEDNDAILEAYAKAFISGGLERAFKRESMAFKIASYHLSCFIFQSVTGEKQILRNKLVKSLLRYYSQKPYNEAMLGSFIEDGLDASKEKLYRDEISRRFQVLEDCCEANSSLMIEVEKLRTSIGY